MMSLSINIGHIIITIFTKEIYHAEEKKDQVTITKENMF